MKDKFVSKPGEMHKITGEEAEAAINAVLAMLKVKTQPATKSAEAVRLAENFGFAGVFSKPAQEQSK